VNYEDNPVSIKYYVKRYLQRNASRFAGHVVVDSPAGNGVSSRILADLGATPMPFDLFPEYFTEAGMTCRRAEISEGIPLEDQSVDHVLCQEGIEHFADQLQALREFNRIILPGGSLILTTPNYSNLRARLSYLLMESEKFNSAMPPNELDSIWMSDQSITPEVYFGHIFLIGIQKLRVLARLAGFRIRHIEFTRAKKTCVVLFPLMYPFIFVSSWLTWRKNRRKRGPESWPVYDEIYRLAVSPRLLVDGHLFVEFEREQDFRAVGAGLSSQHEGFNLT
jgi:SAM-dependent methyltransferase